MLPKRYTDSTVVVWFPSSQVRPRVSEMPGSSGVVEGGVGGMGMLQSKENQSGCDHNGAVISGLSP